MEGDCYVNIHPISRPNTDKYLVGKILDICEKYDLQEGGSELKLSQYIVVTISDGSIMLKTSECIATFKPREVVLNFLGWK